MGKVIWCDRSLILAPAHYGVCLSEKAYHAALDKLKFPKSSRPDWVPAGKDAAVHWIEGGAHGPVAIVCMTGDEGRKAIEVAGLLVHEGVHIWQEILRILGEETPSPEFEAYSIQWISQQLMEAYVSAKGAP